MEKLDHTVEFYKRKDEKIVAKMENPPVEGHGQDLGEALEDLQYELEMFGEGVSEALEDMIENGLDAPL